MKKTIALMLSMIMVVSFAACSSQENASDLSNEVQTEENRTESTDESTESTDESTESTDNSTESTDKSTVSNTTDSSNILIAYFSVPEDVDTSGVDAVAGASVVVEDDQKMGNTQFVAQTIQETIGGDLFRIETVEEYPLEHDALVDYAANEQDENGRPELATHVENFDQYEIILLGFPNWWGDMPMAVYSFLEEYDFGDKTIIPFVTHGGSGASDTLATISQIQPGVSISDKPLIISRNDVATSAEDVIQWAEGLRKIIQLENY